MTLTLHDEYEVHVEHEIHGSTSNDKNALKKIKLVIFKIGYSTESAKDRRSYRVAAANTTVCIADTLTNEPMGLRLASF